MAETSQQEYKVLARKYRPTNFDELIGQEALVRTLSNAIQMNRIAHAFLLTGIRGVGKTTTARIIARALNCVGPDGNGGPTINPCGICEHCVSIASDRHVDVLEMDAASRTGVGDIREIIETVQYRPVSARTKVYIIDEVHMLSNSAFNALLKTLEEPPPHVKFIFATTELRKIPVTVLSRCQRFDLKRIETSELAAHLAGICDKEAIQAAPEALAIIARAAEGSVRDSLSLLDQAIAHTSGQITAEHIQQMIGLADRSQTFELLNVLLQGKIPEALAIAHALYRNGTDPSLLLQDVLDATHTVTQIKVDPARAEDQTMPEAERQLAQSMANAIGLSSLTRCWQALLKGLQEIKFAPHPLQALDMVLIRLGYMAELPPPETVIREWKSGQGTNGGTRPATAPARPTPAPVANAPRIASGSGGAAVAMAPEPVFDTQPHTVPMPADFTACVALFDQQREPMLYQILRQQVQLVKYTQGTITLKPRGAVPADFVGRISHCLRVWTGMPWMIALDTEAAPERVSILEQEQALWEQQKQQTAQLPEVARVLAAFPAAEIVEIKDSV